MVCIVCTTILEASAGFKKHLQQPPQDFFCSGGLTSGSGSGSGSSAAFSRAFLALYSSLSFFTYAVDGFGSFG